MPTWLIQLAAASGPHIAKKAADHSIPRIFSRNNSDKIETRVARIEDALASLQGRPTALPRPKGVPASKLCSFSPGISQSQFC